MIAVDLRIKKDARMIATTMMRAARGTVSVPRTVTTSAPITRKTSGSGASTPIGVSNLRAGERLPNGVRLKSVPTSYYRNLPPPPPGYRFGYYDGYVVAYDPTTQIVADVLDLVNAAVNH